MELIRVTDLCKTYFDGDHEVKALNHVSFTVKKGEFIAITGQSGSGKSTLMHLLGGVDQMTSGSIMVEGKELNAQTPEELAIYRRRQVGLIYQFYNLIPILNVEENIELPLKLDGKCADKARMEELIKLLGLEERIHHLPKQLSGGQQQRAAIGRALITEPALILADEPTGNLDHENGKQILTLLRQSNQKYNQTMILVTHDDQIAQSADRIIRMQDGEIISDTKNAD
ncbi:MAG: ABC transporter ATP-binding protein [Clostridia bacterium]|nr:ABC transporter ATP-binding protein [Clostridia bacterium]